MGAVYKRELKALMTNLYGPVFAVVLLFVVGIVMYEINLTEGVADTSYNLMGWGEYALCLMIPFLCMRSVTYDRKCGADRLYFSLPVRMSRVVLGKYFAILTVVAAPLVILALYPLLLKTMGDVNLASAYASLVMYFLTAAALIALCMFIASLTRYMVVAAVVGVAACALLYFMQFLSLLVPYTAVASFIGLGLLSVLLILAAWFVTQNLVVTAVTAAATVLPLTTLYLLDSVVFHWNAFEGLISLIMERLSPFTHFFYTVSNVNFDLFGVAVSLVFTVFFLLLTVLSVGGRRRA